MAIQFKTGEVAPESGVYRVTHQQHRLPHEVVIVRGQRFPRCSRCGDNVLFELFYASPILTPTFKDEIPPLEDDVRGVAAL